MSWPPDEDAARLQNYEVNRMIMDDQHDAVFGDRPERSRYTNYIAANISKKIVLTNNDLLFGEPIVLSFPELEGGIDGGAMGDDVYQVSLVDGKAHLSPVQAKTWFPVRDKGNVREVLAHKLCWNFELNLNGKKREFLKVMIHLKGEIQYQLWEIEGGKLKRQFGPGQDEWMRFMTKTENRVAVQLPESEPTGVDDFLVVHIPNYRSARQFFGESEFESIKDLQAALNIRLSQKDHVLTHHAEPKIEGPPGTVLDESNEYDSDVVAYELPEEHQGVIKYITWDGQLEAVEASIDRYIDAILLLTETSKDLLGRTAGGSDASGRALKWAARSTLAKVNRRRKNYDVGIRKILELAQLIEGVKEPVIPTLIWPDGLPQDDLETHQVQDARLTNGTQTRKGYIIVMDQVDEETAEKKVAAVDEEERESTRGIADNRPQPPLTIPTPEELVSGL
jgi:hypothetical protein